MYVRDCVWSVWVLSLATTKGASFVSGVGRSLGDDKTCARPLSEYSRRRLVNSARSRLSSFLRELSHRGGLNPLRMGQVKLPISAPHRTPRN